MEEERNDGRQGERRKEERASDETKAIVQTNHRQSYGPFQGHANESCCYTGIELGSQRTTWKAQRMGL